VPLLSSSDLFHYSTILRDLFVLHIRYYFFWLCLQICGLRLFLMLLLLFTVLVYSLLLDI
jgi:hypothetical protein